MNISIGARTDVGGRDNNEDCLAVLDKERVPLRADAVLVIADGMGGRANGEEASGIAVKVVRETLMDLLDPASQQVLPPAEDILSAGMRRANSAVFDIAQANPELPGMGTTCIAALISEGSCTLAHVGDSRAYLLRDDTISPLTHDHTYVADQVRAGNMSLATAKKSRFKNVITRAVGIAPTVEPEFTSISLLDGDTLLFCTDGLSNTLDEKRILEISNGAKGAQILANTLLENAKSLGVRDNVTIIAVRISSDVLSSKASRGDTEFGPTGGDIGVEVEDAKTQDFQTLDEERTIDRRTKPVGMLVLLALAVISATLGGLITLFVLAKLSLLHPIHRPQNHVILYPRTVDSESIRPVTDYFDISYRSAVKLYYQPLLPDFLLLSGNDLIAAQQQTGKMVRLNTLGQLDISAKFSAIVPVTSLPDLSYTTDFAGDVFVANRVTGTIVETSADGTRRRLICRNLQSPGALAVDRTGNIYVINGGELYVIRIATS